MNIPSFHHASLPILEGRAFMLRFSPMEWWFWNARTGFWISLRQTQMQTQERMNSQFKTWILLWNGELFKKTRKRNFRSISLHLLLNFLQMFKVKVKTPGLPCRMRHIFRSLKSLKIFSRMAPFSPIHFTELFRIWASQRLARCRARANVCHHDGEGHGIFLQVVREPWPQLYSIEPPWRWLEMNHDQIRPNLGVCFRVCFLALFFELFDF